MSVQSQRTDTREVEHEVLAKICYVHYKYICSKWPSDVSLQSCNCRYQKYKHRCGRNKQMRIKLEYSTDRGPSPIQRAKGSPNSPTVAKINVKQTNTSIYFDIMFGLVFALCSIIDEAEW